MNAADTEPGVLSGDEVIGIKDAGFDDLLSVIAGGADAMDRVTRWLDRPPAGERFDAAAVKLLAPIQRPPKIICIGLNYRDHAAESNLAVPETPTVFAKFPTSVIGPGASIVLPKSLHQAGLRSGVRRGDRQGRTPHSRRPIGRSTSSATRLSTT